MKKENYFIKALNGMAYGFFCSLIIGTILKQLGNFINIPQLVTWGETATYLMGPAIGVAISYAIDAKGLNLIAAIIAGSIGAGTFNGNVASSGNPIAAFVAVIGAVEVTRLIQGKTPVDILLVPFVSILIGGIITLVVGPYLTEFILWLGQLINATDTNVDCSGSFNGNGINCSYIKCCYWSNVRIKWFGSGCSVSWLLWANDWICGYVNR